MRLIDVLRAVAPVAALAVGVVLAARRRVLRRFEGAGAVDPASAIVPGGGRGWLMTWWEARLARAGVLQATGDGRVWLAPEAWQSYRATRRRRALTVAALALAALGLVLASSWLTGRAP